MSAARTWLRDAALTATLAAVAWLAPSAAMRWARPAVLDFGPNDVEYVRGFRSDWEPDGRTRFHWTEVAARVTLPIHVSGEGHLLRLRARRHFLEPAHVKLTVEGRRVASFDLAADPHRPYRTFEFELPPLDGRLTFVLDVEAPSENPRPLGIALDWMELQRRGPAAALRQTASTRARLLGVVVATFLLLRFAGGRRLAASAFAATVAAAGAAGAAADILASERILREGACVYLAVGSFALAAVRWSRSRRVLGIEDVRTASALVACALVAIAVRLAILLHTQFYYPDVRVHAVFARELAKTGLVDFMRSFTVNQYRFSLGLQFENGHWYAFPYPPAFYLLCWPLLRVLHLSPEVAVSVLAAAVNSLEGLIVFAIARRLVGSGRAALGAAAAHPLLPIFVARLSLAYFPALVGHAADALVLLYLIARLRSLDRPRVVLTLALGIAVALLTYTQSLLNLGLLLPLFLLVQIARDRTPGARRRQAGFALAGLLGAGLSMVFYARYVPIFADMRRGVPMAEERVLLEKMERAKAVTTDAPEEPPDDPFAGPSLDLWRGLRKAAWRLYVFYGPFAPVVVAGVLLLLTRTRGADEARLAATWALTFVLLNLASGGLPGPNWVRYNKDLEIVAPLFCTALGVMGACLWEWRRAAGWAFAGAYWTFGAWRAHAYLVEKFFLDRS